MPETSTTQPRSSARKPVPFEPPPPISGGPATPKPKVKKLRLFLIFSGLSFLAMISTVFGMMMAVASDLEAIEDQAQFQRGRNSRLLADDKGLTEAGQPTLLAKLTGNNNQILVGEGDISPHVKNAVIAIEDRRFYSHEGVDYIGIARALAQDVRQQRAAQGASTITQQFVKNALEAQGDRSVFQKLREAAYAYHLERQWPKEKILTQYLNTVYFGNGAYGVESAARTYFGKDRGLTPEAPGSTEVLPANDDDQFDPDLRAARFIEPHEAALLAAMIASPTAYDPIEHPQAARRRRNIVLGAMRKQGFISEAEYAAAITKNVPTKDTIQVPRPDSKEPYFTTWVTQQLVDRLQAPVVFGGGLKVTTTLDPELQAAAEQAIRGRLGGIGPSASLVAIENRTGEVKALVGGADYDEKPFNLATNGHRQPGSAFKPFILVEALRNGVNPNRTFTSRKKIFPFRHKGKRENFVVSNYEDQYSGIASLAGATASSDNSVYAELGLELGTRKIARLAKTMGIRTKVSTNPAMTLGGLSTGVTPLEMAYAYSVIANDGKRVCGSLASSKCGPVAIERVRGGDVDMENEYDEPRQVFSRGVAQQTKSLLSGVVLRGTGKRAQIGEFVAGKTGTTENYGDAWFVGFNKDLTVAVWVGYPDELKYMETEYHGQPVAGGTFPTEIWHDFMADWIRLRDAREAKREAERLAKEAEENGGTVPLPAPQPGPDTAPAEPEQQAPAPAEPEQQAPAAR
ncbi:MAG TPA: transglycosylase domain-containing protein, partial [Thermoleophilaceae bacterium]|nr:transglycosylase domain-containing protein [Thermoleophilaceae bacterium]